MILSREKLFHMKVRTRSGKFLGKVVDISFDTDSHSVLQYHVYVSRFISHALPFLFKTHILFISHTQVIQWKEHEMVVEDSTVQAYPTGKKMRISPQEGSSIASCSSTDRAAPS